MTPTAVGSTPPPPPTGPAPLPWEDSKARLGSLFPTWGGFIARPIESFGRMSLTVDLVRPLAFYVALLLFGAVVNQVWSQVFWSSTVQMVHRLLEAVGQGAMWAQLEPQIARPHAFQVVLGLIVTPLVYLVVLFVWTLVVHGGLLALGGAKNGFGASLRAMCYSGTAWTGALVPMLGSLVSFVWFLILAMIGVTIAHRTDGWKAALAILVPLALCCLCCIAGAALFGAAVAQAIQQRT